MKAKDNNYISKKHKKHCSKGTHESSMEGTYSFTMNIYINSIKLVQGDKQYTYMENLVTVT
jgi:hypothetical protein